MFDETRVNGIASSLSSSSSSSLGNKDGDDTTTTQRSARGGGGGGTTTVKWQMDRKTFEYDNLRPCNILQREKLPNGHFVYTVLIHNRPGLAPHERIPTTTTSDRSKKTQMHVVTGVPRAAIRFTDRAYSTDQHLENAFRHEIGLPEIQ